jgi:cytochrome c-type biogenesis protein CcmH/NrfG
MREARVLSILADARWAMTLGRVEEAIPLLERAAAIDPGNPDPPAALGELLLASGPDDPDRRAKGERYARLATSLRPRRAFGHFLLSRYRLAEGDPSGAFVEAARARELFPSRRQYVEEAERLKEALRQSGAEGTPAHAP